MKIPLTFAQGKITVIARIAYKRIFGFIEFFVDTGSDTSFVGYTDALRLKIPISTLQFSHHAKIGGGSIELKKINDVALTFRNHNGEGERICEPLFLVADNVRKHEEIAQAFPSILGLNFLLSNKFAFHVNPCKNEAYLEKEEKQVQNFKDT